MVKHYCWGCERVFSYDDLRDAGGRFYCIHCWPEGFQRDTSLDCREIPAIPGPLDIHNCPGCGVSNLYSADGLPVEPVNACKCSVGEDCSELEIPGDLMARLNAEFDAIARRRAELATIRVSVNIAGYSALRNGGRSIEGWNGK